MRATANSRTVLENRRVRTVKVVLFLTLVLFSVLALWQCVESPQVQNSAREVEEAFDLNWALSSEQPEEGLGEDALTAASEQICDPLAIEQEGIELVRANEQGSILWYQSSWSNSQSRILLERALVLKGWRLLSFEDEPVMSFAYPPSATSGGSSLLATFYRTDQGCSMLIELM